MAESLKEIREALGWPASTVEQRECNVNDFLDDILDGKPVHIVDSPRLRRALRRRARERAASGDE